MVNIILDFDGTITDVGQEAKPYILYHAEEFSRRTNVPIEKINILREVIKTEVLENPKEGWLNNGRIVAPACADPYVMESTISRKLFDKLKEENEDYILPANTDEFLSELFHVCSTRVNDVFREGSRNFLDHIINNNSVVIVTNSKEEKVIKKVERLTEGKYTIPVYGNAKKYCLEENLDGVLESTHPEEFPRPVFLRRGSYYGVLKKLEQEKSFHPKNTIVIGDIYELDLALPHHLGYKVALLETEFTPEYEKRFLKRADNSHIAKHFGELIDIIENKNS